MKYLKGCLIGVLAILMFGCQSKNQSGRFVPFSTGGMRGEGNTFTVLDTQTGRIWTVKLGESMWMSYTAPILPEGEKTGS